MPDIPLIAVAVLAIIAVFVLVAIVYAKNYVKVPPNQVAVFTGRGKQKIVRGGARFKMPVIERVDIMELEPFNVPVSVTGIIAVDGVPVNVDGVGLIKFGSTNDAIATAVERFLTSDRRELQNQVREILAGNMRGIVAQMTVEQLNNNREEFRRSVLQEAGADFQRIGMELDVLTIQNITDSRGYLEALGEKRIAEVKRDAAIGKAHAQRDAQIAEAEAKRQGDTAQAVADTQIAQANRERDLELARIAALVDAERATAAQAGPRAQAEARKAVVVADAEAQRAEEEAQISVEEMRSKRHEQAQRADVIIPAEARKQAAILDADAARQAAIAQAEAAAESRRLAGSAEAEARTVAATAHRAELEASAEGKKADLLAEAEGQRELADALNAYSEAAARLQVLPLLIKQLPEMAAAVAAPMGNIDNMVVIDSGKGGGGITDAVPQLLLKTVAAAQAMGIDIPALLGGALSGPITPPAKDGKTADPSTT